LRQINISSPTKFKIKKEEIAHMDIYDINDAPRFALLLSQREHALRTALRALDPLPAESDNTAVHEVMDFKDVAVEQTLARLERANAQRLEAELSQVMSAQRRIAEHHYGKCLDCGDSINLHRLLAMPAAAFCADCQTMHEHDKFPRHQAF
jgi:DnaK suppressor protein